MYFIGESKLPLKWKYHYLIISHRSTASLENFQNLILKYSSKRHSYTPPVYRARNLVAALDHNANCDREAAKRKDGSLRFVFSKGFTHFLNSHLCDVKESLLLTIGCTVKYMIKQIEFYTSDISGTIVKKVVDGLPTQCDRKSSTHM